MYQAGYQKETNVTLTKVTEGGLMMGLFSELGTRESIRMVKHPV